MKKWFKTLCEDVITFISPYIKIVETVYTKTTMI